LKQAKIFIINNGEDPYALLDSDANFYAVADWELKTIKKPPEELEKDTNGKGRWLTLELKPAKSGLDREAKQRCLVGDALTGFRNDTLLLPGNQFELFVSSWRWADRDGDDPPKLKAPTVDVFESLHPNVADRIRMTLDWHIRPNISVDADFFSGLSDLSTQSLESNPAKSEPTTSTPE